MRALLALIFLVLVAALVLWVAREGLRSLSRIRARRRAAQQPWQIDEHSDGELVTVYAVKPGEERLVIGAAAFAANDFDYRVEEVRSQARLKVAALNSGKARRP